MTKLLIKTAVVLRMIPIIALALVWRGVSDLTGYPLRVIHEYIIQACDRVELYEARAMKRLHAIEELKRTGGLNRAERRKRTPIPYERGSRSKP